jgi:hypothetical protein
MDPSASAAAKAWQRTASEDLWQRTLSQIPTQFGRLVYLSRLHNPELHRYEHYGLAAVFGQERAEQALRESHEAVLLQWLAYSMAQQIEDLDSYLTGLQQSRKRLLGNWLKSRSYVLFLPAHVSPAQRALFEANLELILLHLKNGSASGEENPDS